jgi:hypothetical protein
MNPTHAKHYESLKLEKWIKYHYGSVYEASKHTGKSETQLHRWIRKGALIDSDGNVWTRPSGGNLATNNIDKR